MSINLLAGDCRDVLPTLAADSVQCCVCSPPYYALRSYLLDGHADKHREIGSEATPDEYLATMVAVFREIRRVLRPDGTCFVNLGDSYAHGPTSGTAGSNLDGSPRRGHIDRSTLSAGLKPKDLLMMPARLALALQADGWWLRSAITWCKANPMPESAKDRCTSATEMVYMLTKQPRYYFDQDAIRTESGANARNWWLINTEAFPQSHFATFPSALAERCIRAGTSERGACSQCGAPWIREIETAYRNDTTTDGRPAIGNNVKGGQEQGQKSFASGVRTRRYDTTTGWAPGCKCAAAPPQRGPDEPLPPACDACEEPSGTCFPGPCKIYHRLPRTVPCTVLDPFAGAGTTLLVADRLQRDAIGIDLNPDYNAMSRARIEADCPLFTSFPPAKIDAQDERMRDLFREAAD